jgi:hypothetical protein
MVLSAYIEPPAPAFESAAASLTLAVPAQSEAERYAPLTWSVLRSQSGEESRTWTAEVRLRLSADGAAPGRASILLMALDQDDEVVGYAEWEPTQPMKPGDSATAKMTVYSLGPPIERIEIAAEAVASP